MHHCKYTPFYKNSVNVTYFFYYLVNSASTYVFDQSYFVISMVKLKKKYALNKNKMGLKIILGKNVHIFFNVLKNKVVKNMLFLISSMLESLRNVSMPGSR